MLLKRFLRFFILGTAAIFILEGCVAFYLNNFYIKDSGDYSVVKIPGTAETRTPIRKISIGNRATKLSVSHDGNHLAYLQDGLLVLADFATGQKINVPHVSSMKISDYKWIYDRDRLIVTEIKTSGYPYYGKMYYIDIKDRKLVEIRDNYYNKDVKIALYGSGDTVSDLDMSAETNLTFLKVTYGSGKSKLWESNIMVSTNPLTKAVTKNIGRIACLKMSETLFYENLYNGMVYRYGSNTPIKIGGNTQFKLLGVDQSDNVYLAKMSGNVTDCICYGNPLKRNWKSVITTGTADPRNVFVTYQGAIYQDDRSASKLINLKTQKVKSYSGSVIGIYDNGFLSRNGIKILQNTVN